MNPVDYTLNLQRVFAILAGLGFAALASILVFLDPNANSWFVWAFLLTLLVFLTSVITLTAFWWFFSIRKELLTISQVNQIVYQSVVSSCVILVLLVMQQTGQLNVWTGILLLIVYVLYEIWANAE